MAGVLEGEESFDSEKSCSVCGIIENLKRCGKCLSTWYCGREHQVQDWKSHKRKCKELQQKGVIYDGTKSARNPNNNTAGNGELTSSAGASGTAGNDNTTTCTNDERNTSSHLNGGRTTISETTPSAKQKSVSKKNRKKESQSQSKQKNEKLNNEVHVETIESSDPGNNQDNLIHDNRNSQVKRKQSEANYDPRPFRRCHFPVPEDRSLNSLAKHIAEQLQHSNRCIVDDLLPVNAARAIRVEVGKLHESGSFVDGPLSGGKASSDNSKKYLKKTIRSDKITWIQGTEGNYPNICKYMKHLDCIVQMLNGYMQEQYVISGRTKAMVACYPGNGTGYAYHVDNPNKDGRVLTFLYYLNEGWDSETHGGNLRMLPPDGDYIDIEPILNRLLIFWSDRRNPHEVQPAWDSRYAITMWYFDKKEREAAKAAQLNEEMSNLNNDMTRIGMKMKTNAPEKESIKEEIKKQSQHAIGTLSEEELEALAILVESSPDPRHTLTSMNVAPQIQDTLLSQLQERKKNKMAAASSSEGS
ncbi:LOW QUALITY PROTEIN: egl nine homolog 1-like [Amphiura filiformis]|uniref:LOW QUALITY PROTEIN: egl nine homolog 1-like n=1 Tax=Amphiura filiformis TaxID=82378 RepID=UPI003B217D2E